MKIVLLGEQATGKSSLLVALYGALVNRRAGEMRIVRTIDDVEFLSRGLQAHGRHESVLRTEVDARSRLLIDIAHGENLVRIEMPDRSGELVRHMIEARRWEHELQEQITGAEGAILCLRADRFGEEGSAPLPEPIYETVPPAPAAAETPAWSPGQMPADARAVDLLQAVLEDRRTALPLAVVISAWDRAGAGTEPATWLGANVPLLAQFLETHHGQLPHRIFGVSAQGNAFEAAESHGGEEDPWDRAYLVGPDGARGTIGDPIAWLLESAS